MPSRDDDALRWEGDDDPTLDARSETAAEPGEPSEAPVLPEGWRAVGAGSETVPEDDAVEPAPAQGLGNVALVSLGVIGGVYLLWTIGWFLGATRLRERIEQSTNAVADFMFQGSMWLAIASPLLWFAAVLILTRRAATWKRIVLLLAGAVVLVPWPFLMSGSFIVVGG
ncbi:DNA polymerase III subunit gamma/tau [Microbacterium barkeri]|uniref:DNA polymerase III subunit gamma/tau n=1 Tax=Microbacterium barkeri TaxID=33917 RepID=UPI0024AF961B|nr:DNA polymerase III subunit gamma/tau [Microbacterium barkeri]MDI6941914.1 DNA polymerase III subunit gamma/tau [Microbacterium barkeri]